jgi:transcriptional regulator with XRE-family HTH domain
MARTASQPRPMFRLEVARRRQGLSQLALGHDPEVRIAQYFIGMLERGQGIPTPDQAQRIARRLGLKPEDLLKPVVVDDLPDVDEPADESASA